MMYIFFESQDNNNFLRIIGQQYSQLIFFFSSDKNRRVATKMTRKEWKNGLKIWKRKRRALKYWSEKPLKAISSWSERWRRRKSFSREKRVILVLNECDKETHNFDSRYQQTLAFFGKMLSAIN